MVPIDFCGNCKITWLERIRSVIQQARFFDRQILQVTSLSQRSQSKASPRRFQTSDADVVLVGARVFKVLSLLRLAFCYVVVVLGATYVAKQYILIDPRIRDLRTFHEPVARVEDVAQLMADQRRIQNCPSVVAHGSPFTSNFHLDHEKK